MECCRFISFVLCAVSVSVSCADSRGAVDMVSQKRTQYGRILYPPQEKGFDPSRWIAKIESPGMKREEFADVERLLDARSRLYSIAERLRCRPQRDATGESIIAQAYGASIAGYDLYNEPGIIAGSEGRWRELCAKAAREVHANHPGAMVFYPAIYGSNPNGLFNLEPLPSDCEPQSISCHFYSPHSFTHQKTATRNKGQDTCVFYPAWAAPIDWKGGRHFGGTSVDWYDRWTLGAILLPAFEHYARYRRPMHVGEYGVVGYANQRSPYSAFMWTRDATEIIESHGAGWNIWNQGFGLGNPYVRKYIYGLWQQSAGTHVKKASCDKVYYNGGSAVRVACPIARKEVE